MRKTYKREIAVALLVWLMYVTEFKDATLVEVLVWPVFSFAAAAFGFDQYAKLQQSPSQTSNGRGSERGSKRPSGENKLPNAGDYENYGAEDK
jgi:hypothetical protein